MFFEVENAAKAAICSSTWSIGRRHWTHAHCFMFEAGFALDAKEHFLCDGKLDLEACARVETESLCRPDIISRRVHRSEREFALTWSPE